MTTTLRRPLAMLLPLLLVSAACGGDDDSESTVAGPEPTAAGSEPATSDQTDSTEAGDSGAEQAGPFKVGVILPLTGPGAAIGNDFNLGLETFREVDPDAPALDIEYVVCDDKTTPDGAASCARKLATQDQVHMVYGPVLSGPHSGAAPVLASGPPSLTPSPYVIPEEGAPIYSVAGTSYDLDRTNLEFAKQRGYTSLAVLATTDLTGQTAVDNLERANEEIGLELHIERMGPTDVDATAQLNSLLENDPGAIYVAASGAATGVGLKGLMQLGSELPVFLIWSNTTAGFFEAAKPAWPAEALYALSPSWLPETLDDPERAEQVTRFQEAYRERAGAPVSFVVQGGYDAFQLIMSALQETDGSQDAIVAYLDSLTDFQGLNWNLSYSPDNHQGSAEGNYEMFTYDANTGTWAVAES